MFGFFKKKESDEQILSRIHKETVEVFSSTGINGVIAKSHRDALDQKCSDEACSLLVLVAYRTLFLAAGVARHRVMRETQNEPLADRASNSILNDSAIREITRIIRETVAYSGPEPMLMMGKEAGLLFQAATLFDRFVRQNDTHRARKVWMASVEGDYINLPLIVANQSPE